MNRDKSRALFEAAKTCIPGGVNSPVRAFRGVGGDPVFFERGKGAYLYDVDGNEYVDYVGSWGPLILGHAHPEVLAAISEAAAQGTSFGAPTEREVRFAAALCRAVPSMQMVRLVSSGTEATMAALRVARGFTRRDKIVKIDGGYHGASDGLLAAAGSGAATLGIPGSAGVTAGTAQDTLTVAWNDEAAMRAVFDANPGQIAALIVEPVCGNMGCVPPQPGYLEALRELTRAAGTLLIFDEVMTGFRVAFGGAQARYGIDPDLTCLGKIVGGGLPVGAYGGKREIMSCIAPLGPVYQAGTLSGTRSLSRPGEKRSSCSRSPASTSRSRRPRRAWSTGSARWPRKPASRSPPTASARCSPASSRPSRRSPTTRPPRSPTPRASASSSTPCSTAASTSRRRSSRRPSSRSRTTRAPSTARSKPPASRSSRSSPNSPVMQKR